MRERVKKIIKSIQKRYGTSDPFEIAEKMGIIIQIGNIGSQYGFYAYMKKHKCIFLSDKLDKRNLEFVLAHELGHAIMHPKENFYFIRNSTHLLSDRYEREANYFAIELLIPDERLGNYADCSEEELRNIFGYDDRIIRLRWDLF